LPTIERPSLVVVAISVLVSSPCEARAVITTSSLVGLARAGVVVAPRRSAAAPPLEAYTATRRLTCDGVDLDRLTQFTDRHFTQPLGYRPHGERSGAEPR
jgi:hypothetical protein